MDGPRRRAIQQLDRLSRKLRDVEDERDRLEDKARRLDDRAARLNHAIAEHDRRVDEFNTRRIEFDRRMIAYDELATENRILRTELKNSVVHAAYLEHLRQVGQAGQSSAADQRDELGRAYFDEIVTTARKAINTANLPQNNQRVRTAAERVRAAGVPLTPAEEEKALDALKSQFQRAVRSAADRDEQAKLREQFRDEQRRQREAEEAIRHAEREKAAIQAALDQAMAEASGRHAAEVERLQAQLAAAEAKTQRAKSNAELGIKHGHVYVISNIGSLGANVLKIGMTRRDVPEERVKELGDASVPFPFDVHMMIKCDDAPKLESALHHVFHDRRVNRINPRKEFFRVSFDEIVSAVRMNHGEVEYKVDPEAIEFMNSQMATDEEVEEIEGAFAEADKAEASADED
jgi:hypothetical protein